MKLNLFFYKTNYYLIVFIISCISLLIDTQVGIGTIDVHSSTIMELQSNSKGFLMPRMITLERNAISNPMEGLMVYNTDRETIQFFRENVGRDSDLSAWYDVNCENDVTTALASFPDGVILDFSDLSTNGLLYVNDGAVPTQQLISTSEGY